MRKKQKQEFTIKKIKEIEAAPINIDDLTVELGECGYSIRVKVVRNEYENLRRFDAEWLALRKYVYGPLLEHPISVGDLP